MKVFRLCLAATALASLLAGGAALADPADKLEHIKPVLVAPPNVMAHEQATKAKPRVVEFTMTIEEKKIVVDEENGTTMQAMTFNGSMPGPTMVVHEGDYVQLTLINPSTNALEHNIDFHASTGALGGGALTKIKPGEQTVLRFKADRTGTFIYHCAPEGMVPWHVVSGMSGTLMVLPRDGLKDQDGKPLHYDKVYTIGPKKEKEAGDYIEEEKACSLLAQAVEELKKSNFELTPSSAKKLEDARSIFGRLIAKSETDLKQGMKSALKFNSDYYNALYCNGALIDMFLGYYRDGLQKIERYEPAEKLGDAFKLKKLMDNTNYKIDFTSAATFREKIMRGIQLMKTLNP